MHGEVMLRTVYKMASVPVPPNGPLTVDKSENQLEAVSPAKWHSTHQADLDFGVDARAQLAVGVPELRNAQELILCSRGAVQLQDFVVAGQDLAVEGDGSGRGEGLGVGQGGQSSGRGPGGDGQLLAGLRVQLPDALGSGVAGEELLLE